MKRDVTIRKGTRIDTCIGFLEIDYYRDGMIYCTEYKFDDAGELESVDPTVVMTIPELATHIHSMDGLNHRIIWEEK